MKRLNGFTLAEVLITLGVIGVVSALTMPSVINHYQKQATVNKLKKFYTNMNQVMALAKADNGDFSTWSYADSEEFYNNYIKPYIKNVDKVQKNIHVAGDFSGGIRFVFADGTQAVLSAKMSNFTGYNNPTLIYYTNAKNLSEIGNDDTKKPTHDRFYFKINDKGFIIPPYMGHTREQNVIDCSAYINGKNTTYGTNGYTTCSTLIYKDGWKISDDYPW